MACRLRLVLTVQVWKIDPQPTLITALDLPERAYAMDVIGPLIIVATAERKIIAFQCNEANGTAQMVCLLYTSPSPRDS